MKIGTNMKKKEKRYKRLPGRTFSFICVKSLWMASDHLLYVLSWSISENYKRFYFDNIRSITVKETKVGLKIGRFFGAVGIISVLPAIFTGTGWNIFFWVLVVIGLAMFVISLVKGPTCHFYIETAAQTERIGNIGHIASAQKVINTIRPLIEKAQEENPPETGRGDI